MIIQRALISVSDKTGVQVFARALSALGVQLISTGGTAAHLVQGDVPVTEVADITHFPEMLEGRLKTLHPAIHGGILARRASAAHQQALLSHQIAPIDCVVVNCYPFEQTMARPQVTDAQVIEMIDIGGPALLRSAAKNYQDVVVLCDPLDYDTIVGSIQTNTLTLEKRRALAHKAFAYTTAYDRAIAQYFAISTNAGGDVCIQKKTYPEDLHLHFTKIQDLRYGENPHQEAAFYRGLRTQGTLASSLQKQGKALSYNNIVDADTAWACVLSLSCQGLSWPTVANKLGERACACVIVKHANPCGAAIAPTLKAAYDNAFQTDPTAAFGGIIAFNQIVTADTAWQVIQQFAEVVIAPRFSEEACQIFSAKPQIRLLEIPGASCAALSTAQDFTCVGGGLLVQSADQISVGPQDWQVVTQKHPTLLQQRDLHFAWVLAKFVKSNAIVFCQDTMTVGVGAGQMSRVDAARVAILKAQQTRLSLSGSVVASDAFFPFRDGIDVIVAAGATCIIQPGGSMRDAEVIEAANEQGVVMIFTGVRHFRH